MTPLAFVAVLCLILLAPSHSTRNETRPRHSIIRGTPSSCSTYNALHSQIESDLEPFKRAGFLSPPVMEMLCPLKQWPCELRGMHAPALLSTDSSPQATS